MVNQGIRWIVEVINEIQEEYKHWENQNSKSKKAPKMARLDLAVVLCLRLTH